MVRACYFIAVAAIALLPQIYAHIHTHTHTSMYACDSFTFNLVIPFGNQVHQGI